MSSTYNPTLLACHPGPAAAAPEPFTRGALVLTPAGVQVFIAVNRSGMAVTTYRRERQIEVDIWRLDEIQEIGKEVHLANEEI